MTVAIRRLDADDLAGLAGYASIVTAVTPENPTSLEDIAWSDRTYPGGAWFLAEDGGRPVGAATVGRIYMYPATYERHWLGLWVLPDHRRRGTGSAMWRAASTLAREAGKAGFETEVSEAQSDGLAFLLNRGFEVVERMKAVRLGLRGLARPAVVAPEGIELTTLAARPDLETGLHAVALDAYPDIPSPGQPVAVGSLDEFLARDVHRVGIRPDALAIALDLASGEVVGWASLLFMPGSETVAWHDMTAVRRAWRGRGIATALKRATIAWAIEHRLEALETGNDEANVPMRAVNARLGYAPIPDQLGFRGPLAPVAG